MGELLAPTVSRRQMLQAGGLVVAGLTLPRMPAASAATPPAVAIAGDPLGAGYWVLRADGTVLARGSARKVGGAEAFAGVATGLAAHPRGGGVWRVKRNGRVTRLGQATLTVPALVGRTSRVVGVAPNHRGDGLWRVTALGDVSATGRCKVLGLPASDARIAGIAGHPESAGYWILDRRGQVFGFGASRVLGPAAPPGARGIAAHPGGRGYWVVNASGVVTAYGTAAHHGDARIGRAVGIAAAPDGAGYWVLGQGGRVAAFGSARSGVIKGAPPPEPTLTTVAGITVATQIGRRVGALVRHAEDDGIALGGWGYRPYSRQVDLRLQNCGPRYYDVYVKPSSECSPMTAVPGRSLHEQGLAVDFFRRLPDGRTGDMAGTRAFRWMKTNAATYGLYNLPSEPWHWSTTGG